MGMHLDVRSIDHRPLIILIAGYDFQELFPNSLVAPTAKTPVGIFPITIIRGQVSPRCAGPQNPKNSVNKLMVILSDPALYAFSTRKMRL